MRQILPLLAFLVLQSAYAQEKKPTLLTLDPAVRTGKLPNGFTYYIRRNTEPEKRVQLYLVNKVGSVLETDDQLGLAHFMEHMSFNGTAHFPKNQLVDYLQKAGVRFGADLNAHTGFDETVYELPMPSDDTTILRNGFQIMRDWAQDASLDSDEINSERGVVLEEKRLGKGASQRMQEKYLPLLFNNSRYSIRLPIGTESILKNFKPETIRQFYKDWYRPDLQALIVVGDIDVDAVEKLVKQKFGDLKMPANPKPRTKYTIALTGKNQFIAVTDKEFPYTVAEVVIKHPGSVIKTDADYRNSIERDLFNQMLGDRYSELSKKGNPPFIQGGASMDHFLAGLDAFTAVIVAKPGELHNAFDAIWRETERAKQFGFTQTELDRVKQSYLANLESALKEKGKTKSEEFVNEYQEYFLNGQAAPGIEEEYKLVKQQLPGIKLSEINALSKQFITDQNRDVIILAPEKDKDSLPAKAQVEDWIAGIQKEKLTAYSDQVSNKQLIAKKPTPGKVVSENQVDGLKVTELVLSNGVKVILKPTDFKNDEILITAFSPGGTSLYSDADFESATNAASLVNSSGLGDFSSIELPKLLAGKIVDVTPYIRERSEGISGSASPKDFETAMQLIYLYFTAPRMDSVLVNGLLSQAKSSLANRGNDPGSVFSDTMSAVLGDHNFRRTGPSVAKLNMINTNRAFAIYKERFANAGDFTFTFTGSFTMEKIRPLIEQWLGSLPSNNGKEEAVDLGIRIPPGKIENTVYKGTEPKATVRLVFSGAYTYSADNNLQLQALGQIVQIKLIERLRELESGVYSPSARTNFAKYPTNRYTLTVAFGCAPENVEKLIAATFDEINKLKANGAEEADVEKFVSEETRFTENQLRENGFWLNYLSNSKENNEDPKEILGYINSLKKVTRQSQKEAANSFLSGDNLIKLVLLPEQKQ